MNKMKTLLSILAFMSCWSIPTSGALDYPIVGNAQTALTYRDNIVSNDGSAKLLLASDSAVNFSIAMYPIAHDRAVGWNKVSGLPNYQLSFKANPRLSVVSTDNNGHALFQISDYLAVSFSGKDRSYPITWIEQTGTDYCLIPTSNCTNSAGIKYIVDSGQMNLNFGVYLYYLPNAAADQSFDSSTPKHYSGSVILGTGSIRQYKCGFGCYLSNSNQVTFNLVLNYDVTVEPRVCRLSMAQIHQTIDMGAISITELNRQARVQRGPYIKFDFDCPRYASVNLNVQVTDANDLSNTSQILSLDASSTAKGVGIQLVDEHDSRNIILSSTKSIGYTGGTNAYTYTLIPYYIKTGPLSAGKVSAKANLIFTYL